MNVTAEESLSSKDKPSFWFLHCLGWICYVLIFTVDNVFFYRDFNRLGLDVFFPLVIAGSFAALLTWPLRYIYRLCKGLSPTWILTVVLICSLGVSGIWTPLKNIALWHFYEDFDVFAFFAGNTSEAFSWYMLFMSISYSFFMILVWSALYFGINFHFSLLNEEKLKIEAVRLSHIAQIKMLRYQINPHFLFNTLNAISTLVIKDSKDKANGMLVRLSTFLRYSLDNDPEKKIRLYEELKALMLYLEIEKTRFDDRLSVKFEIDKQAETLLVPSLILQPLVENSIKYAIANMSQDGLIEIKAKCFENRLNLEVIDNGPSQHDASLDFSSELELSNRTSHTGVGIQNIIDRLKVLYSNEHSFHIIRGEESGFKVQISIPIQYP